MENLIFQKIIKDCQKTISTAAKKSDCFWFYQLHQKDIIKSAEKLLKLYPKTNKKIVLISCWLHDIVYYYIKNKRDILKVRKIHHIKGAEITERFLEKYRLKKEEILKIKNCILRHRNINNYRPKNLEEKVVAVADTLSHLESIFYLTFFKSFPKYSLKKMVKTNLKELKKDWQDIKILPKASRLVKAKYKVLKQLLENYKN
jgi:HD superfamily phosphodiesterase